MADPIFPSHGAIGENFPRLGRRLREANSSHLRSRTASTGKPADEACADSGIAGKVNLRDAGYGISSPEGDMIGLMKDDPDFHAWLGELRRLAAEQELDWLFKGACEPQRVSFANGLSPAEELEALAPLCEWRGCGCGGG
jgi:hypothetical protein